MSEEMTKALEDYKSTWLRILLDIVGNDENAHRGMELAELNGLFDPVAFLAAQSAAPVERLSPCPLCKKAPGSKVGPPEMVRCVTDGCEGKNLAAYTVAEWSAYAAQPPSTTQVREETIEECAKVAEAQAETFLSPEYASNQPFGSLCERFACNEVAKAIRALSSAKNQESK